MLAIILFTVICDAVFVINNWYSEHYFQLSNALIFYSETIVFLFLCFNHQEQENSNSAWAVFFCHRWSSRTPCIVNTCYYCSNIPEWSGGFHPAFIPEKIPGFFFLAIWQSEASFNGEISVSSIELFLFCWILIHTFNEDWLLVLKS